MDDVLHTAFGDIKLVGREDCRPVPGSRDISVIGVDGLLKAHQRPDGAVVLEQWLGVVQGGKRDVR